MNSPASASLPSPSSSSYPCSWKQPSSLLLLAVILAYVVMCPYTKVEESFNMQAMHDLLYLRTNIALYDHLEFSGVVPRTFIGSLVVSILASPVVFVSQFLRHIPKLYVQIVCRSVLGFLSWLGCLKFHHGIRTKFSLRTANLTLLLLATQFHLPFYMSRPLPNTFALICSLFANGFWLLRRRMEALVIITFAMIIFRCDMLILLGPMTLLMLVNNEVPFWRTAFIGLSSGVVALVATVVIDSMFWRRLLWPEGIVLGFNTVENKSSEWGVSPWHWYVTSAIPKSIHVALLIIPAGIIGLQYPVSLIATNAVADKQNSKEESDDWKATSLANLIDSGMGCPDRKGVYYALPSVVFVALYSILPHKELRFIFPALPMFTVAAASALNQLLPPVDEKKTIMFPLSLFVGHSEGAKLHSYGPRKKAINMLCSLIALGLLFVSVIASSIFALASYHNYPGGVALHSLTSEHLPAAVIQAAAVGRKDSISVHMDVPACMTGVSRFGHYFGGNGNPHIGVNIADNNDNNGGTGGFLQSSARHLAMLHSNISSNGGSNYDMNVV